MKVASGQKRGWSFKAYRTLGVGLSGLYDRLTPSSWFRRQESLAPPDQTPPGSGFGWTQSPYIQFFTKIWGVYQLQDMPVWRMMYRTVPMVKAAVDKTVMMAVTDYELFLPAEVPNREQIIQAIETWTRNHPENWHNVLEQIAHDMLAYGNAYCELVYDDFDVEERREEAVPAGQTVPVELFDTQPGNDLPVKYDSQSRMFQPATRTVTWNGVYHLARPKGRLRWLKILDPMHMRVRTDSLGNVYGYMQWIAYPPVAFTAENMVHFRFMPKSWSYERVYGTSRLLSLVRTQNVIWQLENDLVIIAHAAAKPPMLFRLGTEENPHTKAQLDAFVKDMAGRGPGGDVYVRGDIEGVPLPQPSQNLGAILQYLQYHHEQRIVALGVPPQLLGMPEGSTRTTAVVNMDDWIGTVKSLQATIRQLVCEQVFRRILDDAGLTEAPLPQIVWKGLITKDENDLVRRITSLLASGIITLNEARDLLTETGRKFERLPNGDNVRDPFRMPTGREGTQLPQFSHKETYEND